MQKSKETIFDVYENENAESFAFSFSIKEIEGEDNVERIVESLTARGYIVKTAEWFISKEVRSTMYGKLKHKKQMHAPGTTYLKI